MSKNQQVKQITKFINIFLKAKKIITYKQLFDNPFTSNQFLSFYTEKF